MLAQGREFVQGPQANLAQLVSSGRRCCWLPLDTTAHTSIETGNLNLGMLFLTDSVLKVRTSLRLKKLQLSTTASPVSATRTVLQNVLVQELASNLQKAPEKTSTSQPSTQNGRTSGYNLEVAKCTEC